MFLKVFSILTFASLVELKVIPDVEDSVICPGYKFFDMDLSNVEFDYDDDGYITVNGNFTYLKDIIAPYPLYVRSEHMERGEWRTGIVNRNIPDFCAVIQKPTEVWYPITKQLSQKYCPYKAGYVARIDNVRYKFPVIIPRHFLGEWKMYIEQRDATRNTNTSSCVMQHVSVIDI
ncbi:uncharacterized protein LOC134217038 [Armigeres subalbatus]|uniref:uncharacterized protein LOC134217038 n=1 Tax=Armigeres subalbatus TaxID=124917 RepID=UPI002ED4C3F6